MKSSELPKWFRLLRYWQDEREKRGLSFSLLVGASRDPVGDPFASKEEALAFSKALYDDIATSIILGRRAVTYPCPGIIRGPGFQLVESGEDVELMSFDELWGFYGSGIVSGQFSVYLGKFYDLDLSGANKWIVEALAS